ncbi:MAG TPA: HdeD family acid-resistance protein [Solirubrobacteraceae bacterium]|nr:HdeD family acid-resistance protein [Solirubrobacteraceae bacterium]
MIDSTSSTAGPAEPLGPADVDTLLRAWWVPLVLGVLNLIVALVVLIEPHNSLTAITVVLGIYLLLAGIALVVAAFALPDPSHTWWTFVFGALAVVGGVLVILHPGATLHGVRVIFGIYLLLAGFGTLVIALFYPVDRLREALRGAIDVVGGLVFLAAPKLGLAAVALFVGIYLILRGAIEIAVALELRSAGRAART